MGPGRGGVPWPFFGCAQHGRTLAAARALGLSRRMLAYYRGGAKPVPRIVALAWEAEQRKAA